MCIFFGMLFCGAADAALKINDLIFDNSDNMILFKSSGTIEQTGITKGVLSNPSRVFFDIPDAVLTTPQKTWNLKNSDLEEVRISQFSLSPDVVRVVVRYKINKIPQNFDLIDRGGQLILRHSNTFVEGSSWETVYRNFEDRGQSIFEGARGELVVIEPSQTVQPQISPDDPAKGNITIGETNLSKIFEKNASAGGASALERERKLTSKFFASKASSVGGGIMLSGVGNVNLKPAMFLDDPARLVIDIQNATLAQNLRNKTIFFPVAAIQSATGETVEQRDVLRLGQFDTNTVRMVIQGNSAKEYRTVIAPDLQNLFVAKKMTILNAKLTQNSARVESAHVQTLDPTLELLTVNFSSPIAFSVFEEGKSLHFDMQNVGDFNRAAYEEILKNPKFANTKLTRFALDKSRLSFPLKENIGVNAQITNDGKAFRIYFKEGAGQGQEPVTTNPDRPRIELPRLGRPTSMSNFYKVVLDPGHGGSDTGAIRENINEKDINLPITKMVRDILVKQKVDVHMTMGADKTVSLAERVEFANEINPDVYVSIHANSSLNEAIIGIETHWWRDESYDLARRVHGAFTHDKNLKKWDTKDRGLFKSQFYVINHTKMPAILVEVGFMSNTNELKNITDKKRQQEIAQAIADGIMDYLKKQR